MAIEDVPLTSLVRGRTKAAAATPRVLAAPASARPTVFNEGLHHWETDKDSVGDIVHILCHMPVGHLRALALSNSRVFERVVERLVRRHSLYLCLHLLLSFSRRRCCMRCACSS